jgi:dTDP-4-amino-4,6-dideoxygalactose transaminase
MIDHLKNMGIGTGIHYPVPLHMQKAYASLAYTAGDFPVATAAASQIVSLPMFPGLTAEQQGRVTAEVLAFTAAHSPKYVEAKASLLTPAEQIA